MPGLSCQPVCVELRRADISKRRLQARFVVPEQPGDGFIPGLAPGREAFPVQALDLQGVEQCFAAGIIPTVSLAAHRAQDAVLLEYIPEGATGVLGEFNRLSQHLSCIGVVAARLNRPVLRRCTGP